MVTEDEVNLKNIKKSVFLTFREFLNEVRHTLMNDFVSMSNDEINRYVKMEKLLENKTPVGSKSADWKPKTLRI